MNGNFGLQSRLVWATCFLWSLAGGCSTTSQSPNISSSSSPTTVEKLAGSWERFAADPRIGRYTSSGWGFSTVSYWIEGSEGVVVIDTQFLPSAARELIQVAEQSTGKPVVAAFVLHANPDKFNGTAVFQERQIPVLTSEQVLAKIPEVHKKRLAAFGERYTPDYPVGEPKPQTFGRQTVALAWGGVHLQAYTLGPGCSAAHVAIEFEQHLFVGDLVAANTHSWLELGTIGEWQTRLDELAALQPQFIHPGRGPSGGVERLSEQRDYLKTVAHIVSQEKTQLWTKNPNPTPSQEKEAIHHVKEQIRAIYPQLKFAVFLDIGIPAVWRQTSVVASS